MLKIIQGEVAQGSKVISLHAAKPDECLSTFCYDFDWTLENLDVVARLLGQAFSLVEVLKFLSLDGKIEVYVSESVKKFDGTLASYDPAHSDVAFDTELEVRKLLDEVGKHTKKYYFECTVNLKVAIEPI